MLYSGKAGLLPTAVEAAHVIHERVKEDQQAVQQLHDQIDDDAELIKCKEQVRPDDDECLPRAIDYRSKKHVKVACLNYSTTRLI